MATAQTLYQQDEAPSLEAKRVPRQRSADSLLGAEKIQYFEVRTLPGRHSVELHRPRVAVGNFRAILEAVDKRHAADELVDRTRRSLQWLSENKLLYQGQWVALIGDRLVAARPSARELYAAIRTTEGIPLVVKVEPAEERPFAGW
jgi:hypothetical protein